MSVSVSQPLKRNENLVLLSHEHHHGLVFSTRLRRAGQTSNEVIRSYVEDYWNNELSHHFKMEENLLLEHITRDKLRSQFRNEHSIIRNLIHKILSGNTPDTPENAFLLSKMVRDHIRFEERILFPWLEEKLRPEELEFIGQELISDKVVVHHFKPEFWKYEN